MSDFPKKLLQMCTVKHYYHDEGVGGCQISSEKALLNVIHEWPVSGHSSVM